MRHARVSRESATLVHLDLSIWRPRSRTRLTRRISVVDEEQPLRLCNREILIAWRSRRSRSLTLLSLPSSVSLFLSLSPFLLSFPSLPLALSSSSSSSLSRSASSSSLSLRQRCIRITRAHVAACSRRHARRETKRTHKFVLTRALLFPLTTLGDLPLRAIRPTSARASSRGGRGGRRASVRNKSRHFAKFYSCSRPSASSGATASAREIRSFARRSLRSRRFFSSHAERSSKSIREKTRASGVI